MMRACKLSSNFAEVLTSLPTIHITITPSHGVESALTSLALLSSQSATAQQHWSSSVGVSSMRAKALIGLGQALWPLCQEGLAKLVCRFSTDKGRCVKFAKSATEFTNSRVPAGLLFAAGVAVDVWHLKTAIARSLQAKTVRPAAAQATRSLTTWGAAWAGAELVGIGGALAGIETGPFAIVTGGVGALVGGCLGMFASDWLAQKIDPQYVAPTGDSVHGECAT